MATEKTVSNMVILTTAADLTRCLVQAIAGNQVADTINGEQISGDAIIESTLTMFQRRIQEI
jgi:hypothetical protein|nr:MAG TPA: hypothetical protein [Caudoviricetes sp.]